MDATEQRALAGTLRRAMSSASGPDLDAALAGLGWPDLLAEFPRIALPMVFELLGETGAHASILNDVVLGDAGRPIGGTVRLPYTGGSWVVWERSVGGGDVVLDAHLPIRPAPAGAPVPLAAGRRALGWWLVGVSGCMLSLARAHALERVQFGRRLASFQAVRHRLAETYVAIDGARATLQIADDELGSMLAKAAAGRAALTAARHCQQVLGGMGFTAEHALHEHIRRALVLDGLLGSARDLTREAGALVRSIGSAPRLAQL
jgi:Acyl-CoA dehydrogenase, C-terminal domain